MNKTEKDIKEIVLKEYQDGNIVVSGFDGIQKMPLKDFIKQPAEGMLYDLNRSESVVLTFIKDPKWVNDYAVAKVIKALKQEIESQQTAFAIKVLEEINFKVSTVIATKDEAITKAVLLEDLEETLQNKLNELKNK